MNEKKEKLIRQDILELIMSIFFYVDGGTYSKDSHLIKNRVKGDYFMDEVIKIIKKHL